MPRPRVALGKIRVHVYLRRPDAHGFYATRMVAFFHNNEFSVSPGVRVKPIGNVGTEAKPKQEKWWDPDTGRLTNRHPPVGGRSATQLNATLQHWQDRIEQAFWKLAGPHGYELVSRAQMEAELFPRVEAAAADPGLLSFAELHSAWVKENKGIYSANTLKQQQHVPAELEVYRPGCRAQDLNERFVRGYVQHLLAQNMADGTIYNHFKFLRIVARRLGMDLKQPWLKYAASSSPQPDLEADELRRVLAVTLDEPHLQQERDRWLLELFTCRRDADMKALGPEQLTQLTLASGELVPALRHGMGKVAREVLVPLPPIAVRIGERYNWRLPLLSNQQRNTAIKEIAKRAGLTRLFNDLKISGGKIQDHYRPLHEVISTHTARHTCATLMIEATEGDKSISEYMLGHGIKSNTDIYAKDKARRVAPKVLAAWRLLLQQWYEADPGAS
ncbi:MAG TPA: tyrosine-type recombinase/integrase [Hymenobacter sp.]